ncbi:MAG: hypothetical protein NC302_01460 [Bacteroidales bacterium]|nr:hypothetical protein [Bacteroidales bacterium]MCM1414551.1 hypothetical protein [bacterium]MCM1422601.1 hypothetical protein [bacterium]
MRNDRKYGFQLGLFAALLIVFLAVGHDGPVLFDDSASYLMIRKAEGVMPLYPLYILLNQIVFGDVYYLWAVIAEQAVLAAFSVFTLEETVRKRFGLHPAEGVLISIFALYPYTIEMPAAAMTQAILTEGVAYSLFYLFWALLLKAVWEKSYAWLGGAVGMSLLLAMIRSQLQILFGVCGIIFLYLICMRGKEKGRGNKVLRVVVGIAGAVVVSLAGIALVSKAAGAYQAVMQNNNAFYLYSLQVQQPEKYQSVMAEKAQKAVAEQTGTAEEANLSEEEKEAALRRKGYRFTTSQYQTLIFSRGMYEADYEDAELFSDPMLKGLYLALYEAADAEKQRYAYAEKGLWMWKDIVGGIGKVGETCMWIPSKYYAKHALEIVQEENYSAIRAGHMRTIGLTLIGAHFGRFLYHTLMLLPQAFISTVFFQYAPLYLLCHLITAFLYLSATALMIWGFREERIKNDSAEMMALVLGTNFVMVIVISLVFFGQQRYLVYAFGPFYIAYYVLLRQLWRVRLRDFVKRRRLPGKRGV